MTGEEGGYKKKRQEGHGKGQEKEGNQREPKRMVGEERSCRGQQQRVREEGEGKVQALGSPSEMRG